jgi:hypothetical protein
MRFHRFDVRDKCKSFCLEHRCFHPQHQAPLEQAQTRNPQREQLFATHLELFQLGQVHREAADRGVKGHAALEADANQRSEQIWRELVAR